MAHVGKSVVGTESYFGKCAEIRRYTVGKSVFSLSVKGGDRQRCAEFSLRIPHERRFEWHRRRLVNTVRPFARQAQKVRVRDFFFNFAKRV